MTELELEHVKMVGRLTKRPIDIWLHYSLTDHDLAHMALGIAVKSGELVDAIKKCVICSQPLDVDNVIKKLGDLEFYMCRLRDTLNITREETLKANMKKLAKRYKGYKYSDKQAKQRKDKQPHK